MTTPDRAKYDEALIALQQAVESFANVLGPQECTFHGGACLLDEDECEAKPLDGITVLRSMIIVTEWSNDDGTSNVEYAMPRDQMTSSTIGLLVQAKDSINFDIFGR